MANTLIQIKRSTATSIPSDGSLASGELAYSYSSNIAFIGTSDGAGVLQIGGKYWTDVAVAAFTAANNAQNAGMDYGYVNTAAQAANTWANGVGTAANSYATEIGASSNAWANTISDTRAAASNGWANTVGVAANTYANNTFLPLSGGAITGDLSVTGNLNISGNTSFINVQTFVVNDSLLYLAANNYTSDLVDIGFIGNYVNATSHNVHTAFYREHLDGEYYLIVGYDQEPANNHIGGLGTHNSTLAYLNANIRAQYIEVNSTDIITLIQNASNASNSYASAVGVAANTYASAVGVAANAYADGVGAAANTNASNASYLSTGTVPSARISGSYTGISGVGTLTAGTWNADTITVPYGGTGLTTAANNGVIFGNTAGPFRVTSAGTEGQVLQANADGTPLFGDLDGGVF